MATFTANLKLIDLALGESAGSGFADWGEAADSNYGFLEDALTAQSDITVTTANVTLSDAQFRSVRLAFSGAMTANRSILVPARKSFWFVRNSTTGGFDLTMKVSGQTGVIIRPRNVDFLYCNGTDVVSLTLTATERFLNSGDLVTPPAGFVRIFCRDDTGTFSTALVDKTSGQVSSVTAV
jgi:hypothetical protein